MKAHLIGGGIAALSAAAYLFKDAGLLGHNIHIYEASRLLGGALDASGDAQSGYVLRGGRMFEERESCIHDLFSFIPSRDPTVSIDEDLRAFHASDGWNNKARLVGSGGVVVPSDSFGLSARNLLELTELVLTPEALLDGKSIEDVLDLSILQTNFWHMFGSIFALLPWHSAIETRRYLMRFFHLLPTMASMTTIQRTRYNQYEAVIEPLRDWLARLGVQFHLESTCTDVEFADEGRRRIAALFVTGGGVSRRIEVGSGDVVFITLGSHVADSTRGAMDRAPPAPKGVDPAWALWRTLATKDAAFGNPSRFTGALAETGWVTFTVTARGGPLTHLVEELSGSKLGRGGLMTLKDSPWLLTLTGFHNPHFLNQPTDVDLFWGYGLYLDRPGTVVDKRMPDCTGVEILTEVAHHMGFARDLDPILESSNCIPTLLPYAGSVLMRRRRADRPMPVPDAFTNVALLGQFVEVPDDVVFTTEYAVRGARLAVARLLATGREPPPVYKAEFDPHALAAALKALRP